MSELDNKLRSILEKAGVSYRKNMSAKDAAVDEIKQAFREAGYVPQEVRHLPEQTKFVVGRDLTELVVMSGAEWYRRFEKELGDEALSSDPLIVRDEFHAAARRAAGIEGSTLRPLT